MTTFDLWGESFTFALIYSFIIIVPCIIVAILGKKMIAQMGKYPTKSPIIQMSIFWQLVVLEIITFLLLIGFYRFFESAKA